MGRIPHDSDLVLERGTLEQHGVTVRYCVFQIAPEQWVAAGTSSNATVIAGMGASAREAIASLERLIEQQTLSAPPPYEENALLEEGGM